MDKFRSFLKIFLSLFLICFIIFPGGAQNVSIHGIYENYKEINGKLLYPINPRTNFSDPSMYVVYWVVFNNASTDDHYVVKWSDPNGNLIYTDEHKPQQSGLLYFQTHRYVGNFLHQPGQWKVVLYNNGIEEVSDTFTIVTPSEKNASSIDAVVRSQNLGVLLGIITIILIANYIVTRKVERKKLVENWMITLSLMLLGLSLFFIFINWVLGFAMLKPTDVHYNPFVGYSYIILFSILGLLTFKEIIDLNSKKFNTLIFQSSIVILIIIEIISSKASPDIEAPFLMSLLVFPLVIPPLLLLFFSNRYLFDDPEQRVQIEKPQRSDKGEEFTKIQDEKPFDVFLSYQKVDKNIADAICSFLENKKIKCWYAPRDVSPGKDWTDAISDAIQKSKVFIVVWTSNTQQSIWVKNEVTRAITAGCIIIPFRVDNVDPDPGWSMLLGTTHWLDAYTPPLEKRIDELADAILKNLRE
jgi:hypothetical protein